MLRFQACGLKTTCLFLVMLINIQTKSKEKLNSLIDELEEKIYRVIKN